jgi:hypothetical protein
MKFHIEHFPIEPFEQAFPVQLDMSLFIDKMPTCQEDLSKCNILVLQEPNEYFGLHDQAIANKHLFDLILTYNDKVLYHCLNAKHMYVAANSWFLPEQYQREHTKKFQVMHLCGQLLIAYGHSIRHEILARQDEIIVPKRFYYTYGSRNDLSIARQNKEELLGESEFAIVIENNSHNGYFTEKLIDCFLMRTIPIYWGCSDIGDVFDIDGIITIQNADDAIRKINQLNDNFYDNSEYFIDYNYKIALQYVDSTNRIIKAIKEFLSI